METFNIHEAKTHLSRLVEQVSAGETIATVGDSGGRGRPELYLEVRRGKVPEDPRRWFRGSPR
jgi:septal ring factor EnvC (AmiA/AmiB activator)